MSVGTVSAAAVRPFGPTEVVIGGCTEGLGDAAIAADGTTRGFANCTGYRSGRIWFFRDQPSTAPVREPSPYTGVVYAVAWDGLDSTYVVFQHDTQLKIGKRIESSGVYAPLTTLTTTGSVGNFFTADVVASAGRWWAVWTEWVGSAGGAKGQSELFQRRTLLGVQGRTRITTTAANVLDDDPTLAYANGRITMVWTRGAISAIGPSQSDLPIAESTGGAWLSRPLASLGEFNYYPDVTVYAGVTWVTWGRDDGTVVANNAGGTFSSRTLATPGFHPTVAVSGSHAFVAWYADQGTVVTELAAGTWTNTQVASQPAYPLRVLAQGTKARVIYWAENVDTGYRALYLRTQT